MGEQRTIFQTIKPESSPCLPIISLKAQKGQSYQLTQGCSPRKHIENTYVKPQILFFPTCQVRVVRFYQSSCPPPPPPRLAVLFLVVLLLASSSSFSSTMSASTSTSTSALPTRRQALRQLPSSVRTAGPQPGSSPAQCAPLDLNLGRSQLSAHRWTSTWDILGPFQLSAHRWTSTWDLPSSVRTAGPQPETFPAQCAPLDLNLGPPQLSAHHWTSTAR